jgi:hypothetical protein
MSQNFQIYEGERNTIWSELKINSNIVVGDTIEYITNNQLGYKKYKVISDENGKKGLKLIDSYDD